MTRITRIRNEFQNLFSPIRVIREIAVNSVAEEELATVVSVNLQRATHLRHSILQKVFSGKLVGEISPTIKQRKG